MKPEEKIEKFQEVIGFKFRNPDLAREALTHKSYLNENNVDWKHNERLEFLGDAVLELITTEFLFEKFPDRQEGALTAYRAALVRTESIGDSARKIGVDKYMFMSRGEAKDTSFKARTYILANAYEAIVGAIYLDSGYEPAKKFISDTLLYKIDKIINERLWKDAKSYLQEKAQGELAVTPSYGMISQKGPDHDKEFVFGVYFGEELVAEGSGRNKQDAQQDAAKNAIEKMGW